MLRDGEEHAAQHFCMSFYFELPITITPSHVVAISENTINPAFDLLKINIIETFSAGYSTIFRSFMMIG